jgi:multidrug efflux pump
MVLSDVAIKRPVFATVISLVLICFGLFAFQRLSVREYPDIDPPIVSVQTAYKGASANVIETQVTQIIEEALSGIEGVKTMTSSTRDGSSSVSIEFDISRAIDAAANDVRDKVSRVFSRLPTSADLPVISKVEADARPILWVSLSSDTMSALELTDYAKRYLVDRVSNLNGVANIRIGGERRYSMRIWLDRRAMAAREITAPDVEAALRKQNVELPAGRVESVQREFTVRTDTGMKTPEQFRNVVLAVKDGYSIKLGEVARIELGAEDDRGDVRNTGKPAIALGVVKQSKANTLDVADGVKAMIEIIRPTLPAGVGMDISFDTSLFIAQSIYEVFHALGIALALVVGVIFLFLRSFRATLIPALAIPVSITASFIILAAMGFSLNVLTLLAFVLAIGLVVDDAIVVLENIHRRIEEGEPPLLASIRGARQIGFAVISTTLVLIAVFIPLSLLPGNTGRLFSEFGVSVAAAVMFSGVVALTLTPMLCSKLLKPVASEGWLHRLTEPLFLGLNGGYRWLLVRALGAPLVIVGLGIATMGASYFLFTSLPREFAPTEDRGYFFISVTAPQGASINYTRAQVAKIEEILKPVVDSGDVERVFTNVAPSFGRPGDVRQASLSIRLKPWHDRARKQQAIVQELFPQLNALPGVRAIAINPASLGQPSFQQAVRVVLGGNTYDELAGWRDILMQRMRENPGLQNVNADYEENKPQFMVEIDRARAADLGVAVDEIGRTLETLLGSRNVTTFSDRGEEYNVILQARAEDRVTPSDLSNIFVRSQNTRTLIPLSSLVRLKDQAGASEFFRSDRMRSITVQASLGAGYTLGEAIDFIEKTAATELPQHARLSWRGESREFKESSSAILFTFALALVIVFLVLAAQFESYVHPFVIMLAVPLAVTGALGTIWLRDLSINVYSQIGMIMLVGIVAKNGILIVEFSNQLRDLGKSAYDAVLEASVARLRPILMTSIATAFGAMPLALATGAGAESRQAIGNVIMGGTLFATFMTLFVVPIFYQLLARNTKPASHVADSIRDMEKEEAATPHGARGHGAGHGVPHAPPHPAE